MATFATDFENRRKQAGSGSGPGVERQVRFVEGPASHFGLDLLVQRACDEQSSACGLKMLDREHMQNRPLEFQL